MRILLSTKERAWAIHLARALDGKVLLVDLTPGDRMTAELLMYDLPIYDVQDVLDGMIELGEAVDEIENFFYLPAPAKIEKWNLTDKNAGRLQSDAFLHTIFVAADPYEVYSKLHCLLIDTKGTETGEQVFDFRIRKGAIYLGKMYMDERIAKNVEVLKTGEEKLTPIEKIRRALL